MFVRAYEGDVVRSSEAARLVVPLPESGDEAPIPVEPTAYSDSGARLYRYRQQTASGDHTGLVCSMDVAAFADGRVRGHEQVQPGRVEALVAHLATGPARVELVTTIHQAGPRFVAALADDEQPPLVDVVTADGVRHTVWVVDADPGLLGELGESRHYVADGHHRVAASRQLWEQEGRRAGSSVGVVAYSLDGLALESFGRLVPGPLDAAHALHDLADAYDLDAADPDLRVRADGRWVGARWRGPRPAGAAGLDAALLEQALPRMTLRPVRMDETDLAATADRLGGVGFDLRPPRVADVLAIADAGETVPPKTTYFRPKPASGLFLRASGH